MALIHQMNDFLKELGKQRLDNETRLFLEQVQQERNRVILSPWFSDMQKVQLLWQIDCYVQNFLRHQEARRQRLEFAGFLNNMSKWLS